MTTASPTPFPSTSFGNARSRHATARTFPRSLPSRPNLRRQSPLGSFSHGHGFSADAPMLQNISIGDSSDDDIPQPMNFSALTKAILEDRPSVKSCSPPPPSTSASRASEGQNQNGDRDAPPTSASPIRGVLRVKRNSPSPNAGADKTSPPRIVHLSGPRHSSSLRRTASAANTRPIRSPGEANAPLELITPAPAPRGRRTNSNTSAGSGLSHPHSMHSQSASDAARTGSSHSDLVENDEDRPSDEAPKSQSRLAGEGLPGSMRIRRVPLGSGTFLRGAPMRRPLRRRQSEDDQSPGDDAQNQRNQSADDPRHQEQAQHIIKNQRPANDIRVQDFAPSPNQRHSEPKPLAPINSDALSTKRTEESLDQGHPRPLSRAASVNKGGNEKHQPIFKMPAPPILPSAHDQENEPPPTFKRNKPLGHGALGSRDKIGVLSEQKESKMLVDTPAMKSPQRQPLASRSINTPQRAAPPPPKMSVLETATATAGASTVKSKKKRTQILINGKTFFLRGRIGRGGSSDVYRVMTEGDKIFAWKKVNLEDCNEDTVRGYKGEIDLLKKLENVDRVVRLFDWEINEQKQSLSVLMEAGESDLNRILATRIHPENATLDLSFTRHYWSEMLHCVEAVHAHDIVHSDLKPANFLLVQGRLKLIDFGIANAIDTDNTVNVHRENNVGTPNYMSPESLQDTNANRSGAQSEHVPKLMKLGKPSDVWSLGCILYQMTYGKPPFAHIANQWNRVLAITNPSIIISYPDTGIGGISVPSSLRRILRNCLNRDPAQRLTVGQLLDEREPFLYPDAQIDKWDAEGAVPVTEHILEQIIAKIVERCRDPSRGLPTDDEKRVYSRAFLDRVKSMQRV